MKQYYDYQDVYEDSEGHEDKPIVAAAEDKNPGEVVAVTEANSEANSLNEAVKLATRLPTTVVSGRDR